MPELPEVETVRKVLLNWLKDRTIKNVKVLYPNIIDNCSSETFAATLKNQKINDIERYGKFLVFCLSKNRVISHLRMEGKYLLAHYPDSKFNEGYEFDLNTYKNDKFLKHTHIVFELDNGSLVLYHDVRKFGRMQLTTSQELFSNTPLKELGKDPNLCDVDYVLSKFAKHPNYYLKEALLDQSIMSGIGNIYADEICFASNLSPFEKLANLTKKDVEKIIEVTNKVLNQAIKLGGSSVHSFSFANGEDGKFQEVLNVYGKEGEKCPKCGSPITKTFLNGRGTHFCAHCQVKKTNKNKIRVLGITGLIGAGKSTVSGMLKDNGYIILDADKYARAALDKDSECYKLVAKKFTKKVLKDNGEIDRDKLRSIVIKDKSKIEALDNIIHPYVIKKTKEELAKKPHNKFCLDVPLLFESGMDKLCDFTILVSVDNKTRKQRLIERATMPLKDSVKLNSNSKQSAYKFALASYIIDNSASLANTTSQVEALLKLIENNNATE